MAVVGMESVGREVVERAGRDKQGATWAGPRRNKSQGVVALVKRV